MNEYNDEDLERVEEEPEVNLPSSNGNPFFNHQKRRQNSTISKNLSSENKANEPEPKEDNITDNNPQINNMQPLQDSNTLSNNSNLNPNVSNNNFLNNLGKNTNRFSNSEPLSNKKSMPKTSRLNKTDNSNNSEQPLINKKNKLTSSTSNDQSKSSLDKLTNKENKLFPKNKLPNKKPNKVANQIKDTAVKVGKGIYNFFMLLPLSVKIALAVALVVLVLILIIFIVFTGQTASIPDYESEGMCTVTIKDGNLNLTVEDFVKGVIAKSYYDADEDLIASLTIYISSNIYSNLGGRKETIIYQDEFEDLSYEEDYKPPEECKYLFDDEAKEEEEENNQTEQDPEDETEIDKDSTNKKKLRQCRNVLQKKNIKLLNNVSYNKATEEDIKERYEFIKTVEKYLFMYIEDPDHISKTLIKNLESNAAAGKNYEEIIKDQEMKQHVDIGKITHCVSSGSISGSSGAVSGVRSVRPVEGDIYYPLDIRCNFQCVWYAANRAVEILSTNGGSLTKINAIKRANGNGQDWNPTTNMYLRNNFANDPTCTNFKAGSIIAWKGTGKNAAYGHVAIVEAVDLANNKVFISEGWNGCGGGDASCDESRWSCLGFKASWYDIPTIVQKFPGSNGRCLGLTYLLD